MNASPNGWLQAPSTASLPKHPPLEVFKTLDLDVDTAELIKIDKLRRHAADSVSELTDSRPGGQTWREAHDQDVTSVLEGGKATKLAKLLSGDRTQVGSGPGGRRCGGPSVPVPAHHAEVGRRDRCPNQDHRAGGRAGRRGGPGLGGPGGQVGKAWAARTTAEELLARWRTARALIVWADSGHYALNRDIAPSGVIAGHYWSVGLEVGQRPPAWRGHDGRGRDLAAGGRRRGLRPPDEPVRLRPGSSG
jgi:hypothetical protein